LTALQHSRNSSTGSRAFAAVLCLFLLLFLAFAEVAHTHASVAEAEHCPICIAFHSVAPPAQASPVISLVVLGRQQLEPETRAISRFWHPALFIRPPPSVR
jgi:hypothetical protein